MSEMMAVKVTLVRLNSKMKQVLKKHLRKQLNTLLKKA